MAIQFACPACQQPIEVDDEWADQTVSCPYCRRVVRAPAQSTLQLSTIPSASQPTAGPPDMPPADIGPVPPPPPRGYGRFETGETAAPPPFRPLPRANPIATWSVVVGILAWVLIVLGIGMLVPILNDVMQPIASTLPSDKLSPQQAREVNRQAQLRFQEMLLNDPAARKRAGGAMLLMLAAEACGLTGLILGLLGATRRDARKGAAVAGIVLSGVFLSAQCGVLTFVLASSG